MPPILGDVECVYTACGCVLKLLLSAIAEAACGGRAVSASMLHVIVLIMTV